MGQQAISFAEPSSSRQAGAEIETLPPDLYRRNAFRIAELPVDATERDLTRRQQTVAMASATGLPIPPGPGRALPLETIDGEALTEAMHRLREPVLRLVDEFFWFWPHQLGQSKTDDALLALARGDVAAAADRWARQASQDSEANVSIHNLAVLAHVTALDMEGSALDEERRAHRNQCWRDAFKWFQVLLNDEGFWNRVTARIRDLDDPRLTTGTARRFRTALPLAILSINAQLAVRAAERGDQATASRHVVLMREAGFGFPQKTVDEALQRAVEPIRQRIKLLCEETDKANRAISQFGDEQVDRLLEQATPLLNVLDVLLPINHATRDGMHDEVALTVLECDIRYSNLMRDWKRSLEILTRALPIAASQTAKARLQDNIDIDKRNIEEQQIYGTCWFCQTQPPADDVAVAMDMYGDVTRTSVYGGENVRWKKATLRVPRCPSCKGAHDRRRALVVTALLLMVGGLAVGGLGAMIFSAGSAFAIGAVAGLATGSAMMTRAIRSLPEGVHGGGHAVKHPAVMRLFNEGWRFGEGPATQQ